MTPEFSRTLRAAEVPADGRIVEITATAAECARLAARFGLPAIERLDCRFDLRPSASGIASEGTLAAAVRLICVVTGDEFAADIVEPLSLRFLPPASLPTEIALDGPDEVLIENGTLDLGEAAAEQLALALPPWPRRPDLPPARQDDAPGDDAPGDDAREDGAPGPFAGLRRPSS